MDLLRWTIVVLLVVFYGCSKETGLTDSVVWDIDNLEEIGGNKTKVLSAPIVIDTPKGRAIQFNGVDNGIILDTNPLAGASEFTVEIIFRPDAGGNKEQRFLHMQEVDDHRVLIETRLTEDNKWFLDTFVKSGESERTLYAKDFHHPVDAWYHAALVYDGQAMHHYVNSKKEMEGAVKYVPMKGGKTSIGCRLNKVFWFKGAIKKVKVTPRTLSSEEFMSL